MEIKIGSIVEHGLELWRVIDIDESSESASLWLVGVTNPDLDLFASREHITVVEAIR
jgi:hypothetical protein